MTILVNIYLEVMRIKKMITKDRRMSWCSSKFCQQYHEKYVQNSEESTICWFWGIYKYKGFTKLQGWILLLSKKIRPERPILLSLNNSEPFSFQTHPLHKILYSPNTTLYKCHNSPVICLWFTFSAVCEHILQSSSNIRNSK